MRCVACGSSAVSERPERNRPGLPPVRLPHLWQTIQRTQRRPAEPNPPSDDIALVVLWRLLQAQARNPAEMFLIRGIAFSYEAVRDREAKLTPALAEALRRRRRGKVGRSWYVDRPGSRCGSVRTAAPASCQIARRLRSNLVCRAHPCASDVQAMFYTGGGDLARDA
jgi:hypothetical protein